MATLFQRSRGYFYSRIVVPADLRALIGRREFVKGFGTGSYADVHLLASVWAGRVASLLLHLRKKRGRMTPEEAQQLIQQWVDAYQERGEEDRLTRVVEDDEREAIGLHLSDELESTQGDLIGNYFARIIPEVNELLTANQYTLPKGSDAYRRLCRELLKAKQAVLRTEMERWEGHYTEPARPFSPTSSPRLRGEALSLAQAIAKYLTHNQHRAPATITAKQSALKRFADLIGERDVRRYVKADGIQFRDTVGQLPAHMASHYPGKSVREVLALVRKQPAIARLSKQTVNQDLVHLGHFFSWLIKEGIHPGPNPTEGLSYVGVEGESHDPFTDEELRSIFSGREYAGPSLRPERYWLPLISLHSGARRGEIADLAVVDVQEERGIWFFNITPDAVRGRRLKNKASKRRIPIHSHLIALGWLDFVAQRKDGTKGTALLFPKTENKARGKGRASVDDAVGKWFARLLSLQNITAGKKSFHSFRSTVITALHAAHVGPETRRAITGHGSLDVHESTYLQPSLQTLRDGIEKLDFRPLLEALPRSRV